MPKLVRNYEFQLIVCSNYRLKHDIETQINNTRRHFPLILSLSSTAFSLTSSSSTCGKRGKYPQKPEKAEETQAGYKAQPWKLHSPD